MKAIVIDNIGFTGSYGDVSKCLSDGEEVEVLWQDGCCYKIKTKSDEEYTLNMKRFKIMSGYVLCLTQ